MSLWKFNGNEFEVDFTDALFMGKIEKAYEKMNEDIKRVKRVGKQSEIIQSECNVFFNFFDNVFGKGTKQKLFDNKVSVDLCVRAAESLFNLRAEEEQRYRRLVNKYSPKQHKGKYQGKK